MQKGIFAKFAKNKLIVIALIVLLCIGYVSSTILGDIFTEDEIQQAYGKINFLDKPLKINKPFYYVTGRLYVPLTETVTAIGGSLTKSDDSYFLKWHKMYYELMAKGDDLLYKQLYFDDENPYIYIYDLAQLCNLAVVFNSNENIVDLYYRKPNIVNNTKENAKFQKAYIRLEDITADYGIGGNFTDEGLEKLRVIADYLSSKAQAFYIAWIPLYTNPSMQIQNDLTENFDFYNAHFLYTLDYINNHNGGIVIHGLTHQENDTVSAIGTEFGPNTPFSSEETDNRMVRAKQIAQTLGYADNTFEFPHYSFTQKQLKIAEKHFNFICQQYPYAKKYGYIEKVQKLNRTVTYIPTPLGYLQSVNEFDDMLKKIDDIDQSQFKGLFIHPYIDFNKINCTTTDGKARYFSYDESGTIPKLVKKMTDIGYAFSKIN